MQLSSQFITLALALAALAAPQRCQAPVGAVYFMTNDYRGNSIVVHDVFSDGTVRYANSVSTKGVGATVQRDVPAPDALTTGGSVTVGGNRLYNANPGSNTISVFDINPNDPSQLRLIGRPVNSGGDFPVSVAVSSKNGNVCALNGGKVNGVQCFRPTLTGLVPIANSRRLLNLPQTSPATINDTLPSVSHVLFSPDGSKLVADVKGLIQQNKPGYLAVWDVMADGSLSNSHQSFYAPSQSIQRPFGMTHLNGKEGFVATDPILGGIVFDFSKGYDAHSARVKNIPVPHQQVSCWVSYSSKSDSYFFTDFGQQIVFEAKIDNASLNLTEINQFQLPNTTYILIDNVIGSVGKDQYLYQLAPQGFSIITFDIQPAGKTKLIQAYNFTQGVVNDHVPISPEGIQGLAFKAK